MANQPYWLIHEPDKTHGVGTVSLDNAITSERAIEVWREETGKTWERDATMSQWARDAEMKARLVVLSYDENRQPIVTDVALT